MPGETGTNEIQIRLRTMILGITVAAVLLGITTPLVRQLPPAARWIVIRWASMYFGVVVGAFFLASTLRSKANRRAGRRLLSSQGRTRQQQGMLLLAGLLGVLILMTVIIVVGIVAAPDENTGLTATFESWTFELDLFHASFYFLLPIGALMLIGFGVFQPHICETGVMLGLTTVLPWSHFKSWGWKTGHPNTAILYCHGKPLEFKTTAQDRERLAELLDQYVPPPPEPPEPPATQSPFAPEFPKLDL